MARFREAKRVGTMALTETLVTTAKVTRLSCWLIE